MSTVKKAVVLAAGFGMRLRPFTCITPKPLMPVWGEPMLSRIVSMLRSWGVEEIVVNAHHLSDQIEAWGKTAGVRVSVEKEILGTAGVLNPLRDWIGDDPFYFVNGDIVLENAPDPLTCVKNFDSPDILGCALVTEEGPRTIEVEPESHFVTCWKSPDPGVNGSFTYCGVSVLKSRILSYIPPTGYSSLTTAYEKAMMEGGAFIRAVEAPEMLWTDAGTIDSYINLNRSGEENAFDAIPSVRAALEAIGSTGPLAFLGARGSERTFFRCDKGIIIVYDDGNREENGLYAQAARFLKAKGIPVPEVLADLTDMKTLVLSYAGAEKKMALTDYAAVVSALVKFNALGADLTGVKTLPGFDAETWAWEHNLFAKYCLGQRFHREMSPAVRTELEHVADILEKEPKALVHRDFQSTNILWKNGSLAFIDFQGMRLGPAVYDLASLIYDPYVKISEKDRALLVALAAKESGRADLAKIVPFAAVQRLCQCLGAYGRLVSVGQPQFDKFVQPALENLLVAADEANLDALGALAEDLLADHRHHHHA